MKPQNAQGTLPVFMFFHGGGWILGDFPTHERLVRNLVSESGAVAVFVNYTLSPEAHLPVAINQAHAATRWVADDYGLLNALSDVPTVRTALGQAAEPSGCRPDSTQID